MVAKDASDVVDSNTHIKSAKGKRHVHCAQETIN